jgi:hypothetical protein
VTPRKARGPTTDTVNRAPVIDEIADHVDVLANPSSQKSQAEPIRAELISDGTCTANGLTVRVYAPMLALCRELVPNGLKRGGMT